jgi:prepilin-type N-terminal cleavage/methylation domain-containing protein
MKHPMRIKPIEPLLKGRPAGFTLVEMLIAALVTSIMVLAVYTVHQIQQTTYSVQRELAGMEANLRAAMHLIKSDIRNAGRSSEMSGTIGNLEIIQESGRYDDADPAAVDWVDGFQGITLTSATDVDNDGEADYTNPAALLTTTYRIMDLNGDGRRELRRTPNGGANWVLVVDGVDDMAFAFAYDNDDDEMLDRMPAPLGGGPGNIIWAVDGDAAVGLDTNLDNDNTGIIDENDAGADDMIDAADGGLGTQIRLRKIRAVRIWLLARSKRPYWNYRNGTTYQVGYRVFRPSAVAVANGDNTDRFRFLMLESSVHLRNREHVGL